MAIYTYADFEQAAKQAGLLNQFSKADLTLAQQNPDAGMSILKYKQDYLNASTDEARKAANAGAESVRSSWGGYTGGGDGGSFHLDAMSPNDYAYGSAPSFVDTTVKPTYTNRYDDTYQKLLGQVINRPEFSYSPDTDPLYSAYTKQYTREGKRAAEDALGAAAAATGGLPSTAAVSAAAQAGNYYSAQMTDKIPELYRLAYNKYVTDHSMKLSDLGAVQSAEQADYSKFLDQMNQYNTDRNFLYNQYLAQLDQYNADRNFGYAQHLDEVNNQTLIRQENAALSDAEYQRQLELAQLAASYGDYSGIEALGISPNYAALTSGSGGGGSTKVEVDPNVKAEIYRAAYELYGDETVAKRLSELYTSYEAFARENPGATDPGEEEAVFDLIANRAQQNAKQLGLASAADDAAARTEALNNDVQRNAELKRQAGSSRTEIENFLTDAVNNGFISSATKSVILRRMYS